MGCTWCIPSRRCASAPPPTSTRPPRSHHATSGMGGPPPRCGPRASAPPTPPKPSASGSRPPTPRPGPSAPPPHPAPPATTTPGRGRTRARGGQGTPRGTQARGHRGAPSVGRHSQGQDAGRDTTWGQETTQEPGRGGSGVSAASPICSDFQTFCPDWLHFGHFLCFGGIAASQLSLRIFPIYF